jgi:hypothetical protein
MHFLMTFLYLDLLKYSNSNTLKISVTGFGSYQNKCQESNIEVSAILTRVSDVPLFHRQMLE